MMIVSYGLFFVGFTIYVSIANGLVIRNGSRTRNLRHSSRDAFPFVAFRMDGRKWKAPSLGSIDNQDGDETVDLGELIECLGGSPTNLLRLDSENGIRGVYANELLEEGRTLLKMPLSSCLRDDQPPDWLVEDEKDSTEDDGEQYSSVSIQDWVTRLAASLIETRHKQSHGNTNGNNSDPMDPFDKGIQKWLQLLPSRDALRDCLPIHWPESIVDSIHYRPLQIAIDSAYFARAAPLGDLLASAPASIFHAKEDRNEEIEWALDLVQTRSCRDESTDSTMRLLVPVFDMINHSPEHNAEFFREGDFMMVRALRDIPEGDQVCINYGGSTVPVWRRLFSYGFCDTSSTDGDGFAIYEDDTVEIVLEDRYRFEVSPTSIPEDLIVYEATRNQPNPDAEADPEFTPEIGEGILRHLEAAAKDSRDHRDAALNQETPQSRLLAKLHESHRRTLLACAGGLREYLEEEDS